MSKMANLAAMTDSTTAVAKASPCQGCNLERRAASLRGMTRGGDTARHTPSAGTAKRACNGKKGWCKLDGNQLRTKSGRKIGVDVRGVPAHLWQHEHAELGRVYALHYPGGDAAQRVLPMVPGKQVLL